MGLIDKILGKTAEKEKVKQAGKTFKFISGYEPVFTNWRGKIYESELVRAAIDARSRNISKLKAEFIGTAKPDLTAALKRRPNPWQVWSQFLYRVNTILDCCNNCIIVPIYDAGLNKCGIFPVLPTACKVVEYKDELWLKYKYMSGRVTAACRLNEAAVLTKFQFESDFFGSDNRALDDTMKLITMQNQGIRAAIKNSAIYRFMAKVTNFVQAEDLEEERENFSTRNFGPEAKNGGLLLFPNTYSDIKQIETKAYTVDEKQMNLIQTNVFNYFGVNQDIIQNKAIGDSWSAFYEGAIEPFAIQFSETVTFALYSDREISLGAKVMLTSNRLQYASTAEKKEISEMAADRGLMTIDEIREIWNLAPLPDGKGDRFIARGEYYFIQEENPNEGPEETPAETTTTEEVATDAN